MTRERPRFPKKTRPRFKKKTCEDAAAGQFLRTSRETENSRSRGDIHNRQTTKSNQNEKITPPRPRVRRRASRRLRVDPARRRPLYERLGSRGRDERAKQHPPQSRSRHVHERLLARRGRRRLHRRRHEERRYHESPFRRLESRKRSRHRRPIRVRRLRRITPSFRPIGTEASASVSFFCAREKRGSA